MDDEVEALTAIYADDFTDHGARGDVRRVSVRVAPSIAGSGERAWVSCSVAADLPPGYPDEPASLAVEDVVGLSPAQASELSGVMLAAAVEHAGEPCLYAVAERVREWLSERNERPSDGSAFDDMVRRQRMKDAAPAGPTQAFSREDDPSVQHRVVVSAAEADEATRRKRDGTPVTTASFFAWREAFEAEMAREAERWVGGGREESGVWAPPYTLFPTHCIPHPAPAGSLPPPAARAGQEKPPRPRASQGASCSSRAPPLAPVQKRRRSVTRRTTWTFENSHGPLRNRGQRESMRTMRTMTIAISMTKGRRSDAAQTQQGGGGL